MKKLFLFSFSIFCLSTLLFSQVGMNTDGTIPHTSAMLDVKSSNKGFLPPRMTHTEIAAIALPGEGLVVFCFDCGSKATGALAIFTNGRWNTMGATCQVPSMPAAGTHIPSVNQVV